MTWLWGMPLLRLCKNSGLSTGRTLAMREGEPPSEYDPSNSAAARCAGEQAWARVEKASRDPTSDRQLVRVFA